MSALRQLRKVRRNLCKLTCQGCKGDLVQDDAYCVDCSANSDDIGIDMDSGMELDAQRELARVYLDLRHGRQKDAIDRLERVLDSEAASWRELA